ncbi:hypothetical protein [Xanthobacter flavus]|uniref:hypothetical protein n=1 Tax=Xanthobacter flavus TaxID=281 RepID=UPI00372BEF8B
MAAVPLDFSVQSDKLSQSLCINTIGRSPADAARSFTGGRTPPPAGHDRGKPRRGNAPSAGCTSDRRKSRIGNYSRAQRRCLPLRGRKQAVVPHQTAPSQRSIAMLNRNILYLAIGVLLIVVGVVGYQLYKERQKPSGIEINFGKSGISIEEK